MRSKAEESRGFPWMSPFPSPGEGKGYSQGHLSSQPPEALPVPRFAASSSSSSSFVLPVFDEYHNAPSKLQQEPGQWEEIWEQEELEELERYQASVAQAPPPMRPASPSPQSMVFPSNLLQESYASFEEPQLGLNIPSPSEQFLPPPRPHHARKSLADGYGDSYLDDLLQVAQLQRSWQQQQQAMVQNPRQIPSRWQPPAQGQPSSQWQQPGCQPFPNPARGMDMSWPMPTQPSLKPGLQLQQNMQGPRQQRDEMMFPEDRWNDDDDDVTLAQHGVDGLARGPRSDIASFLSGRLAVFGQGTGAQIDEPEEQFLSIGSRMHNSGTCKPCLFRLKELCFKGVDCAFCHRDHPPQQVHNIRPSKKTRVWLQRRARQMDNAQRTR